MKLFLLLFVISVGSLKAHPVIYKGGWVYQGSFMPQMGEMKLSYTFDPNWSVVVNSHRFENLNEYEDIAVGFNTLVKRWLQHDSQANLYLGAHFGQYQDNQKRGDVGHAMLMADWEDREDYFLFRSKRFYFDGRETQDYMARYGFAPFVAGMNELQAWAILQVYYYEEQSKQAMVTPMLRFFIKMFYGKLAPRHKASLSLH
jgi:hypothetical protein